ncbi:MAG: hypothetical protein ACHQ50_02160 [Fimbriimonadales bacterium]
MRNKMALMMFVLVSIFVIGCGGPTTKLPGDWETTIPGMGPASVSFAASGDLTMSTDFSPGGKKSKLIISGKWSQDGDKVHMTYSDVKFTDLPPAMQAQEKKMEDGAKTAIGMGTDNMMVVKFEGDDAFSSTDNKGVTSSFKRKGK